ncbi:hypothetical protein [Serratia fonticola]|uniref:Prophage protein n=1 Tax=Serratia fonticola TaxID=47917 RepID=A0AAW3WKJ8_SERFO|nr:hypothetical protein [Serratia fonticola]MBC3211408.1 hypothetical protein [Serratia fonticola]NYA12391.1 hypothetical protein [Serratia fonticola]NYA31970.1 hypothetical protein [Serratia fonticola]
MQLIDAQCRVEQAQAVLNIWLECDIADSQEHALVCALINLLSGVPESIRDHQNAPSGEGAK